MTFTFTHFLFGIVLLVFVWMSVDWFLDYLRERGEIARGRKLSRECHLCGKIYPEKKRAKLSECPDCSAENIRGDNRRLG